MKKRFQNKIAESRFALTVAIIICLPVWLLCGIIVPSLITGGSIDIVPREIFGLASIILSTYLIVELNNANVLLRIYSRMVSCCFLVMMTVGTFLYWDTAMRVTSLCFAFFLYAIFHTYQDRQQTGWVYYAFLALAIDSVVFPQILFFVPILWLLMTTRLICMSIKTFCASILGLLTPYVFVASYMAWHGNMAWFISHFAGLAVFAPPPSVLSFHHPSLLIPQALYLAFVLLCTLIGTIHYLRKRQQDRIKTQLLYEMILIINIAAIIFLLLQPQHFNSLMGIIIVCTSPLIAHFIALTHTKWTNMLTKALIIIAIALTVFNIWNPSLNF